MSMSGSTNLPRLPRQIVGFIPVRAGSKRFRLKNFRGFQKTTLLAHAAEKLVEVCEWVIVSSDAPKLAIEAVGDKGRAFFDKLCFIDRPPFLAQDETTTEEVLMDYASKVLQGSLIPPDRYIFVVSQVTSPLWVVMELKAALQIFREKNLSSLVSVNPAFQPNGCFYIVGMHTFLEQRTFFTPDVYLYWMPWNSSIDIDYEHQLRIAEAVHDKRFVKRDRGL